MPSATDKLASAAMGAVKDIKAGFRGLSGVFMHLMEEHGKVGALLKRAGSTSDEAVRAELYPIIRRELLAHERGEVAVVYPVIAQYTETREIAAEHASEAGELQEVIAELDALSYGSVAWVPTFEKLVKLVERHVEREESDYFPRAQKVLGDEIAKHLLSRYEAAKRG